MPCTVGPRCDNGSHEHRSSAPEGRRLAPEQGLECCGSKPSRCGMTASSSAGLRSVTDGAVMVFLSMRPGLSPGKRKDPPRMRRALRELMRWGFSSPLLDVAVPRPRVTHTPSNSLVAQADWMILSIGAAPTLVGLTALRWVHAQSQAAVADVAADVVGVVCSSRSRRRRNGRGPAGARPGSGNSVAAVQAVAGRGDADRGR